MTRRRAKVLAVTGAVVTAATAMAYITSVLWTIFTIRHFAHLEFSLSLGGGTFDIALRNFDLAHSSYWVLRQPDHFGVLWWCHIKSTRSPAGWDCFVVLPMWIPTLATAAVTAYFTRAVRRTRGLCPACGYNLTGAPSPTCPECGKGAA